MLLAFSDMFPWDFTFGLTTCLWVFELIVNVMFAYAVFYNASMLRRPTELVGPKLWGLGTLAGGILVAVAYWFMHHSSFSAKVEPVSSHPRVDPPKEARSD